MMETKGEVACLVARCKGEMAPEFRAWWMRACGDALAALQTGRELAKLVT